MIPPYLSRKYRNHPGAEPYTATDPERGTITWSLYGADWDDFRIDQSGNLTFVNIPDFENPVDADRNNEYLVTVEARDDIFNTAALDVTVTVTNFTGTEEPTIITTRDPSPTGRMGPGLCTPSGRGIPRAGPLFGQ